MSLSNSLGIHALDQRGKRADAAIAQTATIEGGESLATWNGGRHRRLG